MYYTDSRNVNKDFIQSSIKVYHNYIISIDFINSF
jgi:hypothetical protein